MDLKFRYAAQSLGSDAHVHMPLDLTPPNGAVGSWGGVVVDARSIRSCTRLANLTPATVGRWSRTVLPPRPKVGGVRDADGLIDSPLLGDDRQHRSRRFTS